MLFVPPRIMNIWYTLDFDGLHLTITIPNHKSNIRGRSVIVDLCFPCNGLIPGHIPSLVIGQNSDWTESFFGW